MSSPRMVIVAGPSGGGKRSILSIRNFEGVAPFSTDEYCAELNGKRLNQSGPVYVGIPPAIRREAGAALERFIAASISARRSFSFETTLREVTFEQAAHAANAGFRVEMFFIAAGPVEEHVRRVRIRALAGGHSASETTLREIYRCGMRLLVTAFEQNRRGVIKVLAVFHNPAMTARNRFPSRFWLSN